MKKTKLFSWILALLCLLSSCTAEETETETVPETETEAATESVAEETEAVLDLPEGLDLEGKSIPMLIYEADTMGDLEGDELAVAAYHARINAEELLNMKVEYTQKPQGDIIAEIPNLVQAGDDVYAAAGSSSRWIAHLYIDGIFQNIRDLEYIDLDKPWWYRNYIESVSVDIHNPNVLVSDMTYYPIGLLQGILTNSRLLDEYVQMSEDELYQLVLDGKWTTDMFLSISETVYTDINGNGQYDDEDIYPFITQEHYSMTPFIFASGINMESRDQEGYPVLNIHNELLFDLVDKMFRFFKSDYCYYVKENITQQYFSGGTVLMIKTRFADTFWYLREMEDDYMILPIPKYDESLPNYSSFPEGGIQWYGVPITVSDTAGVSAAIEALSYYGHQYIRPTVIEQTMKKKYSKDELSSQIVDIIVNNATSSFLYAYEKSGRVGKIPELFENIFNPKNTTNQFASYAASFEQSTLTALEKLKENFN